jgi:hypothetical protein
MGACLPSGSAGAQSHADVPGGADPDATTATPRSACEKALQWNDQQERLIDALLTLASSERGIVPSGAALTAALIGTVRYISSHSDAGGEVVAVKA